MGNINNQHSSNKDLSHTLTLSTMRQRLLLALSAIIAIIIVSYGADGVRGTDQYWYIADVERIISSEPPITNNYFPGNILRNGAVSDENYIMHNSPMLYLVAAFSGTHNIYDNWIILNIVFHIIVAACIYLIALKFTESLSATLATSFYLISPIAIWQSLNPLLEMYFSLVTALSLACYFYREKFLPSVLLYPLLLLGVITHPIFLAPALIWGVFKAAILLKIKSYSNALLVGIYILCIFILKKYQSILLPSSFQPNLHAIIASVTPGVSNMLWHYTEILPTVDAGLMLNKLTAAANRHLLQIQHSPFYFFTNIALLTYFYFLLFKFKRWYYVLIPTGLFVGQYLALLVLQQNHPRYQQIIAAAVFVIIALSVHQYRSKFFAYRKFVFIGLTTIWIGLVAVDLRLAVHAKHEAEFEAQELEFVQEALAVIPENARIVSIDIMPHNPISYVVRPRDVLFIRTDLLEQAGIRESIAAFRPDYFITNENEPFSNGELVNSVSTEKFGDIKVFDAKL